MWHCVATPTGLRPLESAGSLQAHKCAGPMCCTFGSKALPAPPGMRACSDTVGQHFDCLPHQPLEGSTSAKLQRVFRDHLEWAAPDLFTLRVMYLPGERNRSWTLSLTRFRESGGGGHDLGFCGRSHE